MKSKVFLPVVALVLCVSCGERHLIGDPQERASVVSDFEARQEALPNGALFDVFGQEMSVAQREAMTFLYAYMPLADIVDHSGEYFLENVDCALRARKEMKWRVPEREFMHFVLPLRVNNEDLDDCRKVFYEELKPRIEGLSMYDAVLEVNHWCHEKVIYMPSDGRTSSPLASVKTAYGRCGEESTFTVAALRAVGIPARQVYTPRWAHTDDNHAWVEAWVDGQWYFFGACEPQPVLNLGWFNAPASRGMLMHTRVFGAYNGPEEVMYRTPRNTEINVTDIYAPTAKAEVLVVDAAGEPVSGATVEFKIYNYADFYTAATRVTEADGKTTLSAGKGDMLVWASKDGQFGFSKLSFGKEEAITVKLGHTLKEAVSLNMGLSGDGVISFDLDIVPPAESAVLPELTAEQVAENEHRMEVEDSIRTAYTATFMTEAAAREFAAAKGLDADAVSKHLVASRGNHEEICAFLDWAVSEGKGALALDLLGVVSQKDLRDVPCEVLKDHIGNSIPCDDSENFKKYVLNPRVGNELLTAYKGFFRNVVSEEEQETYRSDPMKLVEWTAENIEIDADCNLGACPISPAGVWRTRVANAQSRNIFFVAMARSFGIPARVDFVTGKVQFMSKAGATDIDFEASEQTTAPTGRLVAKYKPVKYLTNPNYYSHFSISRLNPDGDLRLQNYMFGELDMGGGNSWKNVFKDGTVVDAGDYVMVTGTRLASGTVLSTMTFFTVEPQKTTTVDLVMRESGDDIKVIGSFDSEAKFMAVQEDGSVPSSAEELSSVLSVTGRGYFVVGLLGAGQEPTNHALRDIAAVASDFEEWGRRLVLLFPSEEQYRKFRPEEFPGLPSTVTFGIDVDGAISKELANSVEGANVSTLPLFIIGDTFNRVVFFFQGYSIGLGEQLMNVINRL